MWEMSSRLTMAPAFRAAANSAAGVSFEENMMSSPQDPGPLRQDDLGQRARVGAEALGREDLDDEGIGQGLDREELLEAVAEDGEGRR